PPADPGGGSAARRSDVPDVAMASRSQTVPHNVPRRHRTLPDAETTGRDRSHGDQRNGYRRHHGRQHPSRHTAIAVAEPGAVSDSTGTIGTGFGGTGPD